MSVHKRWVCTTLRCRRLFPFLVFMSVNVKTSWRKFSAQFSAFNWKIIVDIWIQASWGSLREKKRRVFNARLKWVEEIEMRIQELMGWMQGCAYRNWQKGLCRNSVTGFFCVKPKPVNQWCSNCAAKSWIF